MVEFGARRMGLVHTQATLIGAAGGSRWWPDGRPQALERDCDRVELAFGSIHLRNVCESRRRATTVLGGADAARELEGRLADLSAATNVAELSDLFPDDIVDRSPTEQSVRLRSGHDIVFAAGHVMVPVNADGSIDWTQVTRIRILALETRNG
jgi:hypothetical protein